MTSLVIAEHDNHSIKPATLNTVTAALACGGEVHVLVAGKDAAAAAQAAAQIAGVAKVLHADADGFAHGLAEQMAAQVLALSAHYSHILFAATASGKNIAPRVAAKLDVAQVSDITKVDAPDTFERPIYAGNAIATVQATDAIKVITVRTTGFDAAAASGGSAVVESVNAANAGAQSQFMGSEIAKNDRPELTAAKVIVSGGRALGSAEKFNEVITPLADKLGAAMGASRAAVDAGYAPNRQDRRASVVCGLWHQWCHPTSGWHEGQQGDRGHQQRPRSTHLQRCRLRLGSRFFRGCTRVGFSPVSTF